MRCRGGRATSEKAAKAGNDAFLHQDCDEVQSLSYPDTGDEKCHKTPGAPYAPMRNHQRGLNEGWGLGGERFVA